MSFLSDKGLLVKIHENISGSFAIAILILKKKNNNKLCQGACLLFREQPDKLHKSVFSELHEKYINHLCELDINQNFNCQISQKTSL